MKKVLLLICGLLLVNNFILAQTIADFEDGTGGYTVLNWGANQMTLSQVADPTNASNHCLQLHYPKITNTSNPSEIMNKDGVKATSAQALQFMIYLPANTPDSLTLTIGLQTKDFWADASTKMIVKDIPKEVWYPIYANVRQLDIKQTNFNPTTQDFGWFYFGIDSWALHGDDLNWDGNILIDNVAWIGAQPTTLADFEDGTTGGYSVLTWGGGKMTLENAADPAGGSGKCLKLNYPAVDPANPRDNISKDNVKATSADMLVYNVWLPADTPDSLYINIGLQTKDFWQDASTRYYAKDIPKEVWYPIYANIKQLDIKQTNFNPATQDFGWFYVEVGSWLLKGNDLNWNGKLYFDNVGFLSSAVGDKWVIADFESASDPIGKFVVPSASLTLSNLQRVANTQGSGFVMQADADFSKGSIGQIEKSDVKIFNQATDGTKDTADAITLDVFLPADMPKDVIGIQFVYQPAGGSWPWCQKDYIVSDSSLVPGKWNTLVWKVADFASQLTDYTLPGNVFVQLYASPGPSYSGKILFDNLTLQGIKEPAGTVLPVSLTSCVADTAMLNPTNKVIDYVRLDWVDNTLQTCTYNIYMSEKPITSSTPSTASGVVKVAPDIPQGLQKYAIRPYSHDGGVKNYYFAVTSNGKGSETVLQAKSKKGPIAVNTTPTFKIQYVSDFASKFVLDGMDDEFADYKTNQIVPETVNGRPDGWTPESPDVSFKLTLVIDDNYLYISADVSDDDVNTDASMQAWQGDALEFFMGFYDVRYLSAWHTKNFANANGDWRFAFTSRGTTALDGGTDVTIPGIEATNYVKFGGDGYIVEGRINLATLAGKEIKVTDGMLFPFRVDCNDHDATKNDNGRGSQCGIGGCPTATAAKIDLNEDWKRPHGWGFAEVIGAPVGVNEADNNLPKEFKLYSNYPNPFNPATSIKYDLPKSTRVVVKVYDIVGREIATLVDADQKAGYYETKFNAANLASGIYFYRITTPEFTLTKKMMLMK